MTMLTYDGSQTQFTLSGYLTRLAASLTRIWRDYRMIRDLERVPGAVMKDLGYPAAGGADEA